MKKLLGLFLAAVLYWPAAAQTLLPSGSGLSAASGAFTCTSAGICTLNPVSAIATSLAIGGCTIGANAVCATGTGLISGATQFQGLTWIGGGASNLFSDSSGAPSSTQIEHLIRTASALNALSLQSTSNSGYSAVRFIDDTGKEHGAIGYGNSGGAASFASKVYLEISAPSGSTVPSFNIVGGIIGSTSTFWTLANTGSIQQTLSSTGDGYAIRQNNTSGFSTTAYQDSSGNNKFVIGYGLSGVNAPFTSSAYMISVGVALTTVPIKIVQFDGTNTVVRTTFDGTAVKLPTGGLYSWTNGLSDTGTVDTNISRNAAGVVQFGTTAANASGSAIAANFQTGGAALLTLTAGAFGMSKMTASASAPGAAGSKFEVICGTNAGTAKLVMSAGTSGTAVTVVDNVGAGVTGC